MIAQVVGTLRHLHVLGEIIIVYNNVNVRIFLNLNFKRSFIKFRVFCRSYLLSK